ncbi:nucleoside deaminase [Acetobacter sp.]|uniref:nucleoside deaminase n=1 Tax=Acetobacter sp. TaxID=440 RepID=UPI00387E9B22
MKNLQLRYSGGIQPCSGMDLALVEARSAASRGEVPVGAVVLSATGVSLSAAGNEVEARGDPSAHAEMLAMRKAAQVTGSMRLEGCTLVVTLEPCPMCAAAAVHFRVKRIIFGAYDPKGGGIDHGPRVIDHPACLRHPEIVGGVRERENSLLLKGFFRQLRD